MMFRTVLVVFMFLGAGWAFATDGPESWPLEQLPADDSRAYWLPEQVNSPDVVDQFQQLVSASSGTFSGFLYRPVSIALVYPSADVSDFWTRNYLAMTRRLEELNIVYRTTEFTSRQVEHALQGRQTKQILMDADEYDFVIFGPTELMVQAKNIQMLAASDHFSTLIWAFHTPQKSWQHQPDAWFDFSSASGALVMCRYLIQTLGTQVNFALNRGIPGITDDQRSGDFSRCVEEEGQWLNSYEHFGQYQQPGGADGLDLIIKNFPEVRVLHSANTAMAMGVVDALEKYQPRPNLYVTGWGGTAIELEKIRQGKLNATPMRMSDDVGVATAEAIKHYLEDNAKAVPRVYLGRITVANDTMSPMELDELEGEAFRYSGSGERPSSNVRHAILGELQ